MSTDFDFWDVAEEEEMRVPDQKNRRWQKRNFQVVSVVFLQGTCVFQVYVCELQYMNFVPNHCPYETRELTVNPKPCDAPGCAGFTERFMDSYHSGNTRPEHVVGDDVSGGLLKFYGAEREFAIQKGSAD
ncbi:hypothetical protein Q9966_010198 [Columba livia]|nr:hypothetical protein Q9966_010198 [Columba livia]